MPCNNKYDEQQRVKFQEDNIKTPSRTKVPEKSTHENSSKATCTFVNDTIELAEQHHDGTSLTLLITLMVTKLPYGLVIENYALCTCNFLLVLVNNL